MPRFPKPLSIRTSIHILHTHTAISAHLTIYMHAYLIIPTALTHVYTHPIIHIISVADPEGGGGVRGFNPPPFRGVFVVVCLSVYENSHGPGP